MLFIDEAGGTSTRYTLPLIYGCRTSRLQTFLTTSFEITPLRKAPPFRLRLDLRSGQVRHLLRHLNVPLSRAIRFHKDRVDFLQRAIFRFWVEDINERDECEVDQAEEEEGSKRGCFPTPASIDISDRGPVYRMFSSVICSQLFCKLHACLLLLCSHSFVG